MAAVTSAVIGAGTALYGASQQRKATSALKGSTPTGFSAPGMTASFGRGGFSTRRTIEGQRALDNLRGGFDRLSGKIGGLRSQVRPGMGRLTRSRIEAIRGAGSRAVGNLREELSRRRVLGSSFAQREIASTEAEFGRLEEQAGAEAFMQELDMTRELISQEYQASIAGAASVLEQLNFETGVAAQLGNSASQQVQATNVARAQAHSAAAGGAGQILGTVIGAFGKIPTPSAKPAPANA